MSRPLNDIVAELVAKYEPCQLIPLDERARLIKEYDASMEYLLQQMDNYVQQVNYTIEHKQSITIISRITQNLIFLIAHVHDLMVSYSIIIAEYLMDERYNENYRFWKEFEERGEKIMNLIENLQENNIYNTDDIDKDSLLQYIHIKKGFDDKVPPQVELEMQLARENGPALLTCLEYMLVTMAEDLESMKTTQILRDDELLKEDYEINYLLYATTYWPAIKQNFRSHITRQVLRGNVSVSELVKLRRDKLMDFENNSDMGRIWRDYSENIVQLSLQMKNANLNEEQWKYFFQHVFELEELDRWIDELENPPEAKIKAEKLTSNKQFMTVMARAVEQGLCSQQDWQFKWNEKRDAVYFASVASHKFNLSNRHDRDGDLTISWKPFECLFDDKGFRSVYNDYQNGKYKLPNKDIIDKLLK